MKSIFETLNDFHVNLKRDYDIEFEKLVLDKDNFFRLLYSLNNDGFF